MRPARRFPHIDTARLMRQGGEAFVLLVISAAFIAGAVGGSLLGTGELSAAEGVLPGDGSVYGSDSFFYLLFSCAKYHLLVLLFSTSLAGVLLIPATLAFRGFALSCTAAYVASAYPEQGVALILVVLGLPALLTVPSLFVVAFGGELFSARLVSHYVRRPIPPRYRRGEDRALAVAVMLFAAAAVECFAVPPLVRLLI